MKAGKSEKLTPKVYIHPVGFFFFQIDLEIYIKCPFVFKKLFIYMYLCKIEDHVEFYTIMRMDKSSKYLIYNLVVY